jgi:uncharacterized membrane protein YvbJ
MKICPFCGELTKKKTCGKAECQRSLAIERSRKAWDKRRKTQRHRKSIAIAHVENMAGVLAGG